MSKFIEERGLVQGPSVEVETEMARKLWDRGITFFEYYFSTPSRLVEVLADSDETFLMNEDAIIDYLKSDYFWIIEPDKFKEIMVSMNGHRFKNFLRIVFIYYDEELKDLVEITGSEMNGGLRFDELKRNWFRRTKEDRLIHFEKVLEITMKNPNTPIELLMELL